jgi:hypothetical protein
MSQSGPEISSRWLKVSAIKFAAEAGFARRDFLSAGQPVQTVRFQSKLLFQKGLPTSERELHNDGFKLSRCRQFGKEFAYRLGNYAAQKSQRPGMSG